MTAVTQTQDSVRRIVVGMDGSDSPADALRRAVRAGNPAQVLLQASAGADPLVVGGRGLSGFSSALLGSVSQHCVHPATCAIVIVRGPHGG